MKQNVKTSPLLVLLMNFWLFPILVNAQVNCDITIDMPPPVCIGTDFQLSVPEQDNCTYEWKKSDSEEIIGNSHFLLTYISDTTSFKVTVIDTITHDTCTSPPFQVVTYPPIKITFEQLQLTCTNGDEDNGNTAQVKGTATGAFNPSEYHYFWHVHPLQIAPNDSSLAIGLKAHLNYVLEVRDNYGCSTTDTFFTKAYYNAKVKITADPDTAYIERPHITFSFDNLSKDSITITNYYWNFGDDSTSSEVKNPTHTYHEEGQYSVVLTAFNQQGCDTNYIKSVLIEPVNVIIPNVFTPNADGQNDYFEIKVDPQASGEDNGDENGDGGHKNIEETNPNAKPLNFYFESSDLIIFNRHGAKVYESSNYQNDWDGSNLSEGTYYYILICHGFKNDYTFKGSVAIFRGGNE